MTEIELNERILELLTERPYTPVPNRRVLQRHKAVQVEAKLIAVVTRGYCPWIGYVKGEYDRVTGTFVPTASYVKRPRNSRWKGYLKRETSKRARKEPWLPQKGNYYRRLHEYEWELD